VVYFPFDQYVLTPEAQAVVSQAADYAKGGNATKITVVGHTDTSGLRAYNAKLSERRAKAVADALVGRASRPPPWPWTGRAKANRPSTPATV
jgi:OOP family OmpA-OmpF porin